ncbi:MAG: 6-phosphogluconolactonase [Acidobacteria bacterium]|nr:6-phosphogluconolactonase [Acidobacteriota bacterium]
MEDAGEIPKSTQGTPRSWPQPPVLVCADTKEVARAVAKRFVQMSREFKAGDGAFRVALSGGRTPQLLYQLLAGDEFSGQIDWSSVHVFWGDERCVPPEHPESNYGMARRELLSQVPIPRENVHRMEAERPDIKQAARDYEEVLRRFLPMDAQGFPRFHLILLGLGLDGHTASLFPSWSAWHDAPGWVCAPEVESAGVRRMTLTLPVLNAAHHVVFMVTGEDKAGILRRVVKDGEQRLPAQRVRPVAGDLLFIVDVAAAARLEETAH